VARAFRSDAIVSLQFRPPLTRWTFTVIVRADAKSPTMLAGDCVLSARQRGVKVLFFLLPSPSLQIQPEPRSEI
jgi:hypothetical protein